MVLARVRTHPGAAGKLSLGDPEDSPREHWGQAFQAEGAASVEMGEEEPLNPRRKQESECARKAVLEDTLEGL